MIDGKMKLLLTSFGLNWNQSTSIKNQSIFYRMPPINMREFKGGFVPDYASLILCEKIIMDQSSYYSLINEKSPLFSSISKTIKILYSEGYIELHNFNEILKNNDQLLNKMIEHDLRTFDNWITPLKESVNIWDNFISEIWKPEWSFIKRLPHSYGTSHGVFLHDEIRNIIVHSVWPDETREKKQYEINEEIQEAIDSSYKFSMMVREALNSDHKREKLEYKSVLEETLKWYLSYVNSNIIISNSLKFGFHDWSDLLPFYRHKFLTVGHERLTTEKYIEKSNKLFELFFPEIPFHDDKILIKVLNDKRIHTLRELVHESINGKVSFDNEYANRTIKEVISQGYNKSRYRKIVTYLFNKFDFANQFKKNKIESNCEGEKLFYLLSDLSNANVIGEQIFVNKSNSNTLIKNTIRFYEEMLNMKKILFLGANPLDTARLRIDEELKKIDEGLQASKLRDKFELTSKWAVTIETITKAMLDYEPQIVHFAGHGYRQGIAIEKNNGEVHTINDSALKKLFQMFKDNVECVILNACYSENQARIISENDIYVVGIKDSIDDKEAIDFSVGFYQSIGAGKDIEFSYNIGITILISKTDNHLKSNLPILWKNGVQVDCIV
jgi:hypothetical protein